MSGFELTRSNMYSLLDSIIQQIKAESVNQRVELFNTMVRWSDTSYKIGYPEAAQKRIVGLCFALEHFAEKAHQMGGSTSEYRYASFGEHKYDICDICTVMGLAAFDAFLYDRFIKDRPVEAYMREHVRPKFSADGRWLPYAGKSNQCTHLNLSGRVCCWGFSPSTDKMIDYDPQNCYTYYWKKLVKSCRNESNRQISAYHYRVHIGVYFFLALDCPIPVVHALVENRAGPCIYDPRIFF